MLKWLIGILIVVALVLAGLIRFASAPAPSVPPPDNANFQALQAQAFKPLLIKNKVTLVNMWASWCAPCKAEIPDIAKLKKRHEKEGLGVILISLDQPADRAEAGRFLLDQGIGFLTYYATDPIDEIVQAVDPKFGGAIPASFLFNASGEKVDSWQGGAELADFEAKILPLLAK
jgi:thiol-disulfide isomerase/thioredoxin